MLKARIVLADDHKIIRDGIRGLLESQKGLEIVGEAVNGREAVELARKLSPDIVVMDMDMPELNGVEATRQIKADFPRVRVIALSMHSNGKMVGRMLQAGASGYLLKDYAFDELVEAIQAVTEDRLYLTDRVAGVVVQDYINRLNRDKTSEDVALTPKEREVLQLLAEGRSTSQIADRLFVSVKTVETHRKKIMDRLGIQSVAELTKYAIREGLTSLDH